MHPLVSPSLRTALRAASWLVIAGLAVALGLLAGAQDPVLAQEFDTQDEGPTTEPTATSIFAPSTATPTPLPLLVAPTPIPTATALFTVPTATATPLPTPSPPPTATVTEPGPPGGEPPSPTPQAAPTPAPAPTPTTPPPTATPAATATAIPATATAAPTATAAAAPTSSPEPSVEQEPRPTPIAEQTVEPSDNSNFDPSGERTPDLDTLPDSVVESSAIDPADRIRADEVMARADRSRRRSLLAAGLLVVVLAIGQATYFIRRRA